MVGVLLRGTLRKCAILSAGVAMTVFAPFGKPA
jgi:hypothetical protein